MARRSNYEVVFAAHAVEFFLGLTKRRQRKLLDRSRELAIDPSLVPDFRSADSIGRTISHLVVDDFIFDFWVDHAARQVIVTGIDDII